MMCVLMTIPMFAFAAVSGDEPLTIGTPFMITNAGQGPGGKMGRLLVSRAGTLTEDEDFYYVDVPYAADVDARDYSAIVIVIGSGRDRHHHRSGNRPRGRGCCPCEREGRSGDRRHA